MIRYSPTVQVNYPKFGPAYFSNFIPNQVWLSMLPQVEMALQEAEEQLNDGAASPNVVTDFSSRLIESLGKEMGWLGWGP